MKPDALTPRPNVLDCRQDWKNLLAKIFRFVFAQFVGSIFGLNELSG